jgi:small subunit ribosomal protein S6
VTLAEETIRKYETVLVFHPELNKDRLNHEIGIIKDLLVSNGARDVQPIHWGKRELAYRSKKQKQGSYVMLEYTAPVGAGGLVSALATVLRINDRVLKFQTHRINTHLRKFKGNPKRAARGGEEDALFGEEEFN